jgi:hypothetical protein
VKPLRLCVLVSGRHDTDSEAQITRLYPCILKHVKKPVYFWFTTPTNASPFSSDSC